MECLIIGTLVMDTSANISPTHTFNNYGNYTVKLIADGDLCGMTL